MKISDYLFWYSYNKRVPLYTIFEITYKCNLHCFHCYIPTDYRKKTEIETSLVKKTIARIAQLGGLYLVLTGGEPLLRDDVFEIISFAKKLNFVVILFSNGSLIDKNVAKNLKKSMVDKVEVSIYGDELLHNKFVNKEVFSKVENALKLLKKYKISFALKTVLTKKNYKGYNYIKELAEKFNVVLKTDMMVTKKLDRKEDNLNLVLDNKKIADFIEKNNYSVKKHSKKIEDLICSAGFNIVSISPQGDVYPCVVFPYSLGNIKENDFKEIWLNTNYPDLVKNLKNYKRCLSCKLVEFCRRCPGMCYVETNSLYGCSYVVRKMAKVFATL